MTDVARARPGFVRGATSAGALCLLLTQGACGDGSATRCTDAAVGGTGGSPACIDAAEAGSRSDATAVCRSVTPPFVPLRQVEFVYDEPALGPEREGRSRGVAGLFEEDGELLLFGDQNFARLSFDGEILETIPYPRNVLPDEPIELVHIARGATKYGGPVTSERGFCLFDAAGPPATLDDCVAVALGGQTHWADNAFMMRTGTSEKAALQPISETGEILPPREFSMPAADFGVLGESVALVYQQTNGVVCDTRVALAPLGGGDASMPVSIVPNGLVPDTIGRAVGTGPDAALVIHFAGCPGAAECRADAATTAFGTVVRSSGEVTESVDYGGFVSPMNKIYWEDPYFLVLSTNWTKFELYWIDTNAQLVAYAIIIDYGDDGEGQRDGRAALVKVGADEYVMGYGVIGAGNGTRVHRFRVLPPA